MMDTDPRERVALLAVERGASLAGLSAMLGRNANYLQQWIARGSPRALGEGDRRALADFLGVDEAELGAPPVRSGWRVPRLDVAASAGPGVLVGDEAELGAATVTPELARALGLQRGAASIIRVRGDSMAPGLMDGDELLVDEASRTPGARGGVYVVRVDGMLLVKRVARSGRRLVVTSDNPDAAPVGAGAVDVVGKVVWQMRKVS